jgi:dihydroneopterin aldolase
VVQATRALFVENRYKLVEAAAAALARGLLAQFARVDAVHVRVRKLKPPIPERLSAVGVDLRLARADLP